MVGDIKTSIRGGDCCKERIADFFWAVFLGNKEIKKVVRKLFLTLGLVLATAGLAMAALTPEELAQLDSPKLTIVGAERAGSADGVIPAYTGGITKGPDGWYYEKKLVVPFSAYDPKKSGRRPDPFADDKPLYTIDASNVSQYADKLSVGTQALFKRYPDYKMHVYPTRRPAAYPQFLIDGTKKSAATAKLEKDGLKLTGAAHGIPFPMPKTGLEAMWNFISRWGGDGANHAHEDFVYQCWLINAAGQQQKVSEGKAWIEYPYWDPGHPRGNEYFSMIMDNVREPVFRVGEGLIWLHKMDKTQGDLAWQYLPGQRRVKLAPEIGHDYPNVSNAGASTYDETYVWLGSPERFDWKLLGKKEMIVPYDNYRATYWSQPSTYFKPHFTNPDDTRWEVHRVWAIQGTLKKGFRHIYGSRVIYADEDTWNGLMHDTFDHNGKPFRVIYDGNVINYDVPTPLNFVSWGYDLIAGVYYYNGYVGGTTGGIFYTPRRPDDEWAPQSLAGAGVR